MKKIYIHVGLHKTGTTFLQKNIFPFLKKTFCIIPPYTGEKLDLALNKLQYADDIYYDPNEIVREVENIKSDQILISDESLSGVADFNCINRSLIANRLSNSFPDSEIILFLRGQKDIINSSYNQVIKVGKTCLTIDDYIYFPNRNISNRGLTNRYYNSWYLNIHPDNYMYYELIKMYSQKFSKVHVFLYEDFKENNIATANKLLSLMNDSLSNEVELKNILDSTKENAKLSDKKINYIRYRNIFRPILKNRYIVNFTALLYSQTESLFKKKRTNEEYVEELIADYFCKNNQKIMQEYPNILIKKYPDSYKTFT